MICRSSCLSRWPDRSRSIPPDAGSTPGDWLAEDQQAIAADSFEPERCVGAPGRRVRVAREQDRRADAGVAGRERVRRYDAAGKPAAAQLVRRPHAADLHGLGQPGVEAGPGDQLAVALEHPDLAASERSLMLGTDAAVELGRLCVADRLDAVADEPGADAIEVGGGELATHELAPAQGLGDSQMFERELVEPVGF